MPMLKPGVSAWKIWAKLKNTKSWTTAGFCIKPHFLTGGMKITYGWADSQGSSTVTLQTRDRVRYKMMTAFV